MFKKLIVLLFIASPLTTFAQSKIAYIDTQTLFSEMPGIKDAQTQLEAKNKEYQKTLQQLQDEYSKQLQVFTSDTAKVTDAENTDRQNTMQKLGKKVQDFKDYATSDLQDQQQKLMAPIQQKLLKAIQEVGEANNFTYIIEAQTAPYISPSAIDASKLVRAKLGIKAPVAAVPNTK